MIEFLENRIAPAALHVVDLGGLNGKNGLQLGSGKNGDAVGSSVQIVPDINGDGIDDILIGAQIDNTNPGDPIGYVVYGREGGFTGKVNLSKLKASEGFKILGGGPGVGAFDVADLNGDGRMDIVVGTPGYKNGLLQTGAVFVAYGTEQGFGKKLDLDKLTPGVGVAIIGEFENGGFGSQLAAAGDVNGDGVDDIIVGAPSAKYLSAPNAVQIDGAAYVIFGNANLSGNLPVATLNGTNGFRLNSSVAGAALGLSVAAAGDLNGDGLADIAVGAAGTFDGSGGGAFVIYGSQSGFAASIDVTALSSAQGLRIHGDGNTGRSLAGLGDVNGDGLDDLAIGGTGVAFVVYGQLAFDGDLDLDTASSTEAFRFVREGGSAVLFLGVRSVGDWNQDGFADVAVFAGRDTYFDRVLSSADVIFGGNNLPATLSAVEIDGVNGFSINRIGLTMSAGGDINGDGRVDLAFGNPQGGTGFGKSGLANVYYGPTVKISANGKTAIYSDPDGDLVTLKTSKGRFEPGDFTWSATGVLQTLDLTDGDRFGKATITATVKRSAAGDGLTAIGFVNASGVDLKSVSIKGDFGRIVVGDLVFDTIALKQLTVHSLGRFGVETQEPGARSTQSEIAGVLGEVKVTRDVRNVSIAAQQIDSLQVGGNVIGSSASPVRITATGAAMTEMNGPAAIGTVRIGGNVEWTEILAGFDASGVALNPTVSIGRVQINGDFRSSSIIAGIDAGADGQFGTDDDNLAEPGVGYHGGEGSFPTIGSVRIKGSVHGTNENGDHFAIAAMRIVAAEIEGRKLNLEPLHEFIAYQLAPTGDVLLRELWA